MQTLCPMNVHRRKTQKFEFQKKEKPAIVIINGNITTAEPHRKEITIVPRFFFRQQQRETNLYFPLTTNNKNGQVCPISRLPSTKEEREREGEKKKKGTRKREHKDWHREK
jgi:hypothetical protein